MRGFLSFDEYFNAERNLYYNALQMQLPSDFYQGRNDCDITEWLEYFANTIAKASEKLRLLALSLQAEKGLPSTPWDQLPRRQQQVLVRLVARIKSEKTALELLVRPSDIESWFAVSDRTARQWLSDWTESGFVSPIVAGAGNRIHKYQLSEEWQKVTKQAS
ncbi:MAG: hypothetical protein SGJ27_14280 [Candidatus Melainabacteria bacterium]|nr:hypothetical protein [Candidatus Melainabacteria bacterium]